MNPKIYDFIGACESLHESLNPIERPEAELFCVEQLCTLLSNIIDDHPEIETDIKNFIGMMKTI